MGTVVEEWNELEGKGLGEVSERHDMCSLSNQFGFDV